ncbi:MAG TPA: c-type cytochrome [Trueperaceae bacterium]
MLLALCAFAAAGLAQEAGGPTVMVAERADYLTDPAGMSLYIYLRDAAGVSTCYGQCEVNWPPYTVPTREVTAGPGVVGSLLGTTVRRDGSYQATFAGWPLYYHARDAEPGDTYGQTLGDVFFLISSSGVRLPEDLPEEEEEEAEAGGGQAAPATAVMQQGEELFAGNCSTCHGDQGQGLVGPALAGNPNVGDMDVILPTILFGREDHGMPPFGEALTDEQIAAVATFVRNSWGNSFGPVTESDVAARR